MGNKKKPGLDGLKTQDASLGQTLWQLGEIRFDERARELSVAGKAVAIQPCPASLLMVLLRHPNSLVNKEELFRTVWAGRIVTESVLTKCVAKLRSALGDEQAALIQTVHGLGYRLNGLPQALDCQPAAPPSWRKGVPLPDRSGWRLHQQLERLPGQGDWWSARHEDGSEWLLCAARDAETLENLRRELAAHRLVSQSLGSQPSALEPLTDCNLAASTPYLAWSAEAINDLPTWLAARRGLGLLDRPARLALAVELCRATARWHDAGASSPNGLRPSNFVLRSDHNGQPRATLIHVTRGSPLNGADEFTPPEQCQASRQNLNSSNEAALRSDLYSLGVIVYKLLAGNLEARQSPGWEAMLDDPLLADDVAQATQLIPERRLPSVQALLERLLQLESRHIALADLEATRRALGAEQLRSKRWRRALLWSVLVGTMVCGTLGGTLYAGQAKATSAGLAFNTVNP